jgi:rSAM/selenodomain-associated transferase 2
MPQVSLIIPVFRDTAEARKLLVTLVPDSRVEIIIVDGGCDLNLDKITASRTDVKLLRTSPGRGRQMNVGGTSATGNWLLFLHADCRLPHKWLTAIDSAGQDPATVGGWFQFQLNTQVWQARILEYFVALRIKILHLPYGDQGIFVKKMVFEKLGGFREWPLMEDVDFVRRLQKNGKVYPSVLSVITSARRWEQDGWVNRSARNLILISLYCIGVSPTHLAKWYR